MPHYKFFPQKYFNTCMGIPYFKYPHTSLERYNTRRWRDENSLDRIVRIFCRLVSLPYKSSSIAVTQKYALANRKILLTRMHRFLLENMENRHTRYQIQVIKKRKQGKRKLWKKEKLFRMWSCWTIWLFGKHFLTDRKRYKTEKLILNSKTCKPV